jgi:hypothetical protein
MNRRSIVATAGLLLSAMGFATTSSAQPIRTVDADGNVTAASGVLVLGTLYDVRFVSGTCIDVFTGCNASSDFFFQSQASATAASQALLDFVFLDSPQGQFDSYPTDYNRLTQTPFEAYISGFLGASVRYATAVNYGVERTCTPFPLGGEVCSGGETDEVNNDGSSPNVRGGVWAVWAAHVEVEPEPNPTVVPEPSSLALLALGGLGLFWQRKRSRRA